MHVRDLMSYPVVVCREQDRLSSVAAMMRDADCGMLPVVDATEKIVGAITDRDMCMAALTQGRCLRDIHVAEVITGDIYCVRPIDTLRSAERIMSRNRVRRLPVVGPEDRVVGILSLNDIARVGLREQREQRPRISSNEVLEILAAVGESDLTRTLASLSANA